MVCANVAQKESIKRVKQKIVVSSGTHLTIFVLKNKKGIDAIEFRTNDGKKIAIDKLGNIFDSDSYRYEY